IMARTATKTRTSSKSRTREPALEGLPSPEERAAAGKAARADTPRSSHAEGVPEADSRDPVAVLEKQAKTRAPELVPIRHGRMLASAFAFYRGAAAIMAADLAGTPSSGFEAQLCGDAHLENFGAFAAPDRQLVFDCNDFDETLPGPWEWDAKRLAASFSVAGRERGFDEAQRRAVVATAVRAYREAMRHFADARNLDVWYERLDVSSIVEQWSGEATKRERKRFERNIAKARTKDSMRAFSKLTREVDGDLRIISDPPLIVPFEELFEGRAAEAEKRLRKVLGEYRSTLPDERRRLLDQFHYLHTARKVVGVGSVGTRAYIVLLIGRDRQDPLFLQAKEAEASVLEPFIKPSEYENHGQRVVQGQRLMQAASDSFLGWLTAEGPDGKMRDFYVRQLWDQKGSALVDVMNPRQMTAYAQVCGSTLARAHARSGDRIAIASYLGRGQGFDRALADFAESYADLNERDYRALREAAEEGRVPAEEGV
ncbi:MAG TPA: DUF2252 domain-containing protein, partial [Solirubrobacterales bacterium]|nr:DUF2252 domain-containing protein [Solirubrobacterales bacterium]